MPRNDRPFYYRKDNEKIVAAMRNEASAKTNDARVRLQGGIT